ncbi:MAG: hypothetical protein A2020_05655 [Lentisphaerae bacterium GWF2_45_14]|nr:MAG: hypothetical protein A2020_05655 [Lentisphaerae bacterium GWF2_45_14]
MEKLGEKIKTGDWTWNLRKDSGIPVQLLDTFISKAGTLVKSNDIRQIYAFDGYYLKHESPISIAEKIRNVLCPKARSEFESALLLEKHSIPCAEYYGWGRNGEKTIICSKELADSVNAYDMWFGNFAVNPDSPTRQLFLENLCKFLRNFFESGLFHPDLHAGNLLVRKSDMEFFIVDPYGIRKPSSLSGKKRFSMYRIFGAFRGELSNPEAVSLILKSGMAPDDVSAQELWQKILNAEAAEMKKLWKKRKTRMRSGKNTKYYTVKEMEEGTLLFRNIYSMPCPENIAALEDKFISKKVPKPEAERLWLLSLFLQFHRLEHLMPAAWLKRHSADLDTLYWEKRANLFDAEADGIETLEYFKERCRIAGFCMEREDIAFDSKLSRLVITNIDYLKKS